jgi:DNA-binding NarL/FixJ family response regulator
MVTKKIAELAEINAKAAALAAQIEKERTAELSTLPVNYGYDNLNDFIKALKAAYKGGAKGGKRRGSPAKVGKVAKATKPAKKGKRGKITDETRAAVKSMVGDGKTGAEIAKALGISLPSVQNIKKDLGLVQARGTRKAKPAPAAEAAGA